MKRLVVVASTAVLMCAGMSGALAGEVKGPPNQLNNTNETGALAHANSACAASGLNDFDPKDMNPSGKGPKGAPGKLGLCRGGTGQR